MDIPDQSSQETVGLKWMSARESLLKSTSSTVGSSILHKEQFDTPIQSELL
jgi:hypothetical protein